VNETVCVLSEEQSKYNVFELIVSKIKITCFDSAEVGQKFFQSKY